MDNQKFLEEFVKECAEAKPEEAGEKFVGWEPLVALLVYEGVKTLLPELREWIKLGATVIAMKRLEIKKRLVDYAAETELDFPAAEKAAEVVADKINEENVGKIINALENRKTS